MNPRNRVAVVQYVAVLAAWLLTFAAHPNAAFGQNINGVWEPIQTPLNRYGATIVVDPVQHRMVMFGGFEHARLNDVWTMPLTGAPGWTRLFATGDIAERFAHSAFYDAPRQRMIVFGGDDNDSWNSVYALSLAGTPAWTQITPAGDAPHVRAEQTAIYDSLNDRMVMFGGFDDTTTYYNDVWALSLAGTPTWTNLTPAGAGPSPRFRGTAVYDAVSQRMIVFGGQRADSIFGDTWALSLTGPPTWSQVVTPGVAPAPRYRHTAIVDPIRNQMVVFGGSNDPVDGDNSIFDDAWTLSLGNTPAWSQLTPTGSAITARYRHAALYDPFGDRMLVFAGSDPNLQNDVKALRLGNTPEWSEVIGNNAPIDSDNAPGVYYDSARDRMLIYIGTTDFVGALTPGDPPQWSALAVVGAPPGTAAIRPTAIVDARRDRLLVFGGVTHHEVWQLTLSDPPTWTQLSPVGTPPSSRLWSTPIYDPVRDRMLIYGGVDLNPYQDFNGEVWALSLSGALQWEQLPTQGTPPEVADLSTAIYDPIRDRMVVYGGRDPATNPHNETWVLPLSGDPAWSQLVVVDSLPPATYDHAMVYDPIRDRLVTFGGYTGSHDVWALALSEPPAWTKLSPVGDFTGARLGPSAIYDPMRDRMEIFGGNDGSLTEPAWTLTWGSPIKPVLAPVGAVAWTDLPFATARYLVTNPLGGARSFEWTLASQRDWPGFPLHGQIIVGASSSETLTVSVPVPDSATAGHNAISLRLSLAGAAGNDVSNTRDMAHTTTATLASLVTAEAQPGRAYVTWRVSTAGEVRIERSAASGVWQEMAMSLPDGLGNVSYDDAAVVAGERYGYRVAWGVVVAGEVWLDIPNAFELALRGVSPNPSTGAMTVSFSLPVQGRASVDLCDVLGRIVEHRAEEFAAGVHVVALAPQAIAPGVYWVRMGFEGRRMQKRVVVVR